MASKKKSTICIADTVQIHMYHKNVGTVDCIGIVRYIGNIHKKLGIWYGIELNYKNRKIEATNGTFNNIQYFKCNNFKAIFVKKKNISLEKSEKKKNSKKKKKKRESKNMHYK
eukprot:310663_1